MGVFSIFKTAKLENELMNEIKSLAGVTEFPMEDAQQITRILVQGYKKGSPGLMLMLFGDVIAKYPELANEWDELMLKYKRLGMFKAWDV